MTTYKDRRDLCRMLFPEESLGIPTDERGTCLSHVVNFIGCSAEQIDDFYRALEGCGFVRLADGTTGRWEPLPPTSEELMSRAEAAGFDLDVALAFEGPNGPTAQAWSESPFMHLHPEPRLHPKPGTR